jgi:hypothetical protein
MHLNTKRTDAFRVRGENSWYMRSPSVSLSENLQEGTYQAYSSPFLLNFEVKFVTAFLLLVTWGLLSRTNRLTMKASSTQFLTYKINLSNFMACLISLYKYIQHRKECTSELAQATLRKIIAAMFRCKNPSTLRTKVRNNWYRQPLRKKVKVVPMLNELSTTPWRRLGEWLYRATFCWPRHKLEVSGELHAPAALPPVPIG